MIDATHIHNCKDKENAKPIEARVGPYSFRHFGNIKIVIYRCAVCGREWERELPAFLQDTPEPSA